MYGLLLEIRFIGILTVNVMFLSVLGPLDTWRQNELSPNIYEIFVGNVVITVQCCRKSNEMSCGT